jgi:hypothetical protein
MRSYFMLFCSRVALYHRHVLSIMFVAVCDGEYDWNNVESGHHGAKCDRDRRQQESHVEFVFIHSHQPVVGNSGRSRPLDSSWFDISRETLLRAR